jgi:hypothetical protein
MTLDEQVYQAFRHLSDRLRDDIARELQNLATDVIAKAGTDREIAVEEAAMQARITTERDAEARLQAEQAAAQARLIAECEAVAARVRDEVEATARESLAAAARDAEVRLQAERDAAEAKLRVERDAAEVRLQTERDAADARLRIEAEAADVKLQSERQEARARLQAEIDAAGDRLRVEREAAEARLREARAAAETHGREVAEARAREALAQAERRAQAMAEAAAAASRDRERAASLAATARLSDTIRAIDRSRSLSEILGALVDGAAAEASRVGLLLVRHGELRGWRFVGFDPTIEPASAIVVSPGESGILGEAIRTRESVSSDTSEALSAPAFAALPAGREGFAVPVSMDNEVIAVLYADQGAGREPIATESALIWPDALELMARHAARCLEAMTATRTMQLLRS